jgi:serine/threonine protein kinase
MNNELTSSDFLEENFFTAEDSVSEYVELTTQSRFNQFYKVKRFGRWFILKGLKPEYVSEAIYVSLLKKEFELSAELSHPNIVVTILKEDNPRIGPAIMMEYIDGMTLNEFLATNPSTQQRQKVVLQLLDAMQYIHSKQITHRDLKPSNILITRNGLNVKIIDFGLADADNYAIFKQPAGTVSYAAPEQMVSGSTIDCRTDIYSFGLILREIFPKRYSAISRKCTQSAPSKRYANAADIQHAIHRQTQLRKLMLPIILSVLLLTALFFLLFNRTNDATTYSDPQQMMIDEAFTEIDKIYRPYMDSLTQGLFVYREFALVSLAQKSKSQGKLLQSFLQQIPADSPFYGSFMASFTGYAANEYFYPCNELKEKLPSFFEEHNEGRISDSEFEKLYAEYDELHNLQN